MFKTHQYSQSAFFSKMKRHILGGAAVSRTRVDPIANCFDRCVICMIEFERQEEVRYLPCMHNFHRHCIDDWLMRDRPHKTFFTLDH